MPPPRSKAPARREPGTKVSLGVLEQMLGFHLRRAQVAVWRDYFETVTEPAIRPALFAMLVLIEANPGIAQIELSQALGIDKATLVALVAGLEQREWVSRRQSAADRRRQGLYLSERGGAQLGAAKLQVQKHERRLRAQLRPRQAEALLSALKRLQTSAD